MLRKKGVFGDKVKNNVDDLKTDFVLYRDYLSSTMLPSYLKDYIKK
ncbi:hypothetical protein [Clostridium isatidis]